ncbi:MAG: aspartate kinase [Roseivirga sp.]
MKVFKFGGASIQNPESVRQLAQIVHAAKDVPLVMVVSAMGKTTRALEHILQQKVAAQSYYSAIQQLGKFHQDIIDRLFKVRQQDVSQALAMWKERLISTLSVPAAETSSDKLYSQVVAQGELLASQLIHYYLQEQHVPCVQLDARNYIKTNLGFCSAQVDEVATQNKVKQDFGPLLAQGQVVLTQGFIASNAVGETTTLGKEGSDFTGALLATALGAQSLTAWKDVPGVMSADPKRFKNATKLDRISYQTMVAMALDGAKVVHPKTIQPLAEHSIPLYVKPFHHPEEAGTTVVHEPVQIDRPLYILREDQGLVQLSLEDWAYFDEERLQTVLSQLTQQGMRAHMLVMEARTLSICWDDDPCKVEGLLTALQQRFKVHYRTGVGLLTIMHPAGATLPSLLQGYPILLTQHSQEMSRVAFQYDPKRSLSF